MVFRGLLLILSLCLLPLSCGEKGTALRMQDESVALTSSRVSWEALSQTPTPHTQQIQAKADSLFRQLQRTHDFNGVVLIANRGKVLHHGAYGQANLETGEPLTEHSVFQLASVSKVFTATAIMMLYEADKLAFDDPLVKFFPRFPYPEITVRHLLNHRSGLCRYMGLGQQHWDRRYFMSYHDVVDLFVQHQPRLWFTPGTQFYYNNTNYVLLAALVEHLAMQPFEAYLQTHLFEPLGMQETYLVNHLDRLQQPRHTVGYKYERWRYRPAGGDYLDGVFGDKGVHATVWDLFRFEQALSGGQLLQPETLLQAYQPGGEEHSNMGYGFGWRMKRYLPDLVYHFGWWRGYRSCLIRDLQAETTLIILTNRDHPGKVVPFWGIYRSVNQWLAPAMLAQQAAPQPKPKPGKAG